MTERRQPSQVAVFFGFLLMAVGGLIVLTAGACSAMALAYLGTTDSLDGMLGMLMSVLLFGGLPLAAGAGLFIVGRRISKPRVTRRD